MQRLEPRLFLIVALCLLCWQPCLGREAANLILTNAEVYTMEADRPWASSVVITGNKIAAVLTKDEDVSTWKGPNTRIVDLKGQFVVPGFIDGHVHFNGAGGFINGANLLKVSDREGLRKEMQRVVAILDDGEWITGGIWGAYEQWADGASGSHEKKKKVWEPNRGMIDDLTPDNPCLLNNFNNRLYLVNTPALKAGGHGVG